MNKEVNKKEIEAEIKKIKETGFFSAEKLRSIIPKDIYELLIIISREGFCLTLVGGSVRDYLLKGEIGNDFDFELRHHFDYSEKEWLYRVNRLGERLREIYHQKVDFLSFSILRITCENHIIEIAPARIESYKGEGPFAHSDFDVKIVSNANYIKTFERRDFTLNAMGIECGAIGTDEEFRFIDPFNGLDSILNKELSACSSSFTNDPVRFLRLLRFKVKYNLAVNKETKSMIGHFDLSKLSQFYFFRESFKIKFGLFIHHFFDTIELYNLKLAQYFKDLSFLKDHIEIISDFSSVEEVLIYLIYKENPPSFEELSLFELGAGGRRLDIKGHLSLRKDIDDLELFNREIIENKFNNLSLLDFLNLEELQLMKSFQQGIKRKNKEDILALKRLNLPYHTRLLKIETLIPRELEGKEKFLSLVESGDIPENKRGELRLYSHFYTLFR